MILDNFIIINNENNICDYQLNKKSIIKNVYNINILNNIDDEYVLLLDYKEFVEKMYNSYDKNDNNIYEQFKKDYHRTTFYINNICEKNLYIFTDYFEFLLYQYNLNYYEFLLFCTQAVMGSPLELLYKIINKTFNKTICEELYVGEIENNVKKYSKVNKKLIYNLITKNKELYIIINKVLRIFYINENSKDITLYYVKITLNIPFFSKENVIITYKLLKNK